MIHLIAYICKIVAVLCAFTSMLYYLVCIWSASQFHTEQIRARNTKKSLEFAPPISILKPLKGADPGMYEGFRSHCLQDYPQYEIVFGVSDPSDPSLQLVEQLKKEFPAVEIRTIVCEKILGTNVKVSNLAQMLPQARYEHLIVNDSDILVGSTYLTNVITLLSDAKVGLVTCLYRGQASPTLGSRLESLGISTDFAAGVLTARYLENGIRFGMGSTLALRRKDLQAIGGFEALLDYLADDYQIGYKLAEIGKKVKLSETVVQTSVSAYSFRDFWRHQLRWARTIRDSRRSGYFGLVFTFGLAWAIAAIFLAHGAAWACILLGTVLALRIIQAVVTGRMCLQDEQVFRFLWLLPLRDLIAVAVWLVSFFGHTIRWRGDLFYLKDGKLIRA